MAKYVLELSDDQARTVVKALDLFGRIGMGQFEEVVFPWRHRPSFSGDHEIIEGAVNKLKKECCGLTPGASFGICSEKVSLEYKRAYEIQQVLRLAIATAPESTEPRHSVWFSSFMPLTDEKPPIAVVV